jgi:hypothetical protein
MKKIDTFSYLSVSLLLSFSLSIFHKETHKRELQGSTSDVYFAIFFLTFFPQKKGQAALKNFNVYGNVQRFN